MNAKRVVFRKSDASYPAQVARKLAELEPKLRTAPARRRVVARVKGNGEGETPHRGAPSPAISRDVSENEVGSVLALANKLSKQDRQELLDLLALNNQMTSKAANSRDLDMWSEAVGIALGEVIGAEAGGSYGVMLIKRLLGSTSAWRPVEAFMTSSKLQCLRVPERQSIYLLLARLLVRHAGEVAVRSGAPLGPKLLGACTGSLAGVFEQNFPGYLAAGLAPMVAKQMQVI